MKGSALSTEFFEVGRRYGVIISGLETIYHLPMPIGSYCRVMNHYDKIIVRYVIDKNTCTEVKVEWLRTTGQLEALYQKVQAEQFLWKL